MSWDNYYSKHCARYYGWLPASLKFKEKKGHKLSYFTLCDTNAIDIFMLEMEGVLQRDENKSLTGVTICEMDEGKISEIFKNVNPPLREAIVKGKVQHLLLFEDTEELRNLDPEGDIRSLKTRRRLNTRRDALRLQERFPFDIINFDPCDSLLHPQKELFKSFDKLFEFQKGVDQFLIFTTTPISNTDNIMELFDSDFKQNINDHEIIKEAATKFLKTHEFKEIPDENKKVAIGFGKTLLAKLALKHNYKCSDVGIFIYENDQGNLMLSSVTEVHTSPLESDVWYPQEISSLIEHMPKFYSFDESQKDTVVKGHLEQVITSRDQTQMEFSDSSI